MATIFNLLSGYVLTGTLTLNSTANITSNSTTAYIGIFDLDAVGSAALTGGSGVIQQIGTVGSRPTYFFVLLASSVITMTTGTGSNVKAAALSTVDINAL